MKVKTMKRNNPRSVRGAERRGWRVLEVKDYAKKNVSWLGLCIWSDRHMKGHYVQNFQSHKFAFERDEDASHFLMKWCL